MVTKIIYKYRTNNRDTDPCGKNSLESLDFRAAEFCVFVLHFDTLLSQQRNDTIKPE